MIGVIQVSVKEEAQFVKAKIRGLEKNGDPQKVLGNLKAYLSRLERQLRWETGAKAKELGRTGMRSGGVILAMAAQAYMFDKAQQAEMDKAAQYYREKLEPRVISLNEQGYWVAVIAVMDAPKYVDIGSLLTGYKEIRELHHFVTLYCQTGRTREEALRPPPAPAAIGPASVGEKYSGAVLKTKPPEGRKWVDVLYLISAPMERIQ